MGDATDEFDATLLRDFPPTNRYLVGVSGGRDSVALLHWLVSRGYRRLVVCHLDHQLRGRSSAADARFVERLAEQYELDFEGGVSNVRGLAKENRASIETAARAARYAFFFDVARRRRCRTILLAHHADDLVETFLMNLFRGSAGARSIRPVAFHALGKTQLSVVRPLLYTWRAEIDDYVRDERLKFREDASNATLQPTRNRMRHRIIPMLEKEFGRAIRKSIWRSAIIAADEDAQLDAMMPPAQSGTMTLKSLRDLSAALQRRAVRTWLRNAGVPDIDFELIERVRALADPKTRIAKTNLPRNRHVRRRAGKLFIE